MDLSLPAFLLSIFKFMPAGSSYRPSIVIPGNIHKEILVACFAIDSFPTIPVFHHSTIPVRLLGPCRALRFALALFCSSRAFA